MKEAAAIVCMTEPQKEWTAYRYKQLLGEEGAQKIYAFSDFCGYSVPDPYGQPMEVYEDTFNALEGGMSALINALFPKNAEKPTAENMKKTATKKKTTGARKGRPKKEKITE